MVVNIAQELKSSDMFEAHLQSLFLNYLMDKAMGVRLHGAKSIKKMEKILNNSWLEKEFLPKLENLCFGNSTYIFILSGLYSQEQVGQISSGAVLSRCVNNLIKATKNKVANVKFTAVKLLKELYGKMSSEDQNNAQQAVKSLFEEKNQDTDVKYFSQQFLQNLK